MGLENSSNLIGRAGGMPSLSSTEEKPQDSIHKRLALATAEGRTMNMLLRDFDSPMSGERRKQAQFEAEIKRDDDLVFTIVEKHIGLPRSAVSDLFDALWQEPRSPLASASRKILDDLGHGSVPSLTNFIKARGDYASWVSQAMATPHFEVLRNAWPSLNFIELLQKEGARYFTYGAYEDISKEEGNIDRIFVDEPAHLDQNLIEGNLTAEEIGKFFERIETFEQHGRKALTDFEDWTKAYSQLSGTFRKTVGLMVVDLIHRGKFEGLLTSVRKELLGALGLTFAFDQALGPTIAYTRPVIALAARATALGGEPIFAALSANGEAQAVLEQILPRLEVAKELGVDLKELGRRLLNVPLPERLEFLELALTVPKLLSLGASNGLIRDAGELRRREPTLVDGRIQALAELKALDRRGSALETIMGKYADFVFQGTGHILIGFAHRSAHSHLAADFVVKALLAGDKSRLDAVGRLLSGTTNGATLQSCLQKVGLLRPEDLAQLLSASVEPSAFVTAVDSIRAKNLIRPSAPIKFEVQSIVVPTKKGDSWYKSICEQFVAQGGDVSQLDSSAEVLGPQLRSRLRQVHQASPDLLPAFVTQLITFGKMDWFREVIANSFLMKKYIEALERDPAAVATQLERISALDNGSDHSSMRAWLYPEEEARIPAELRNLPVAGERLPTEVAERTFERIVAWGRFNSGPRKDRLEQAAAGMPIILHDTSEFGRYRTHIYSPKDLVLCLTSSVTHRVFYNLKRDCAASGAMLLLTHQEGTSYLEELIRQVSSRRTP